MQCRRRLLRRRRVLAAARRRSDRSDGARGDTEGRGWGCDAHPRRANRLRGDAAMAALLRGRWCRLGAGPLVAQIAPRALIMRAASSERGTGRRTALLALFTFVAAALLATYPLLRHPTHTIAGGLGDPIILTTVLAWDADRLWHGLHGLWDPPFLYPHHWTLAYCEHMLGVAIFTAPVEWLFGNPVLTYNVAYIGSYVLAGVGMFLLTRALWGRAEAAMLAGLAFALTPYRLAQTTHLQVLMNGWMPIGLLALHR